MQTNFSERKRASTTYISQASIDLFRRHPDPAIPSPNSRVIALTALSPTTPILIRLGKKESTIQIRLGSKVRAFSQYIGNKLIRKHSNFAPHRLFDTTPLAQSQRSVPASQRSQLRHLHMETLKRESRIRNFASGSAIEYFLSHKLGEPFPVPPTPQQRSTPPQKLLSKARPFANTTRQFLAACGAPRFTTVPIVLGSCSAEESFPVTLEASLSNSPS